MILCAEQLEQFLLITHKDLFKPQLVIPLKSFTTTPAKRALILASSDLAGTNLFINLFSGCELADARGETSGETGLFLQNGVSAAFKFCKNLNKKCSSQAVWTTPLILHEKKDGKIKVSEEAIKFCRWLETNS